MSMPPRSPPCCLCSVLLEYYLFFYVVIAHLLCLCTCLPALVYLRLVFLSPCFAFFFIIIILNICLHADRSTVYISKYIYLIAFLNCRYYRSWALLHFLAPYIFTESTVWLRVWHAPEPHLCD